MASPYSARSSSRRATQKGRGSWGDRSMPTGGLLPGPPEDANICLPFLPDAKSSKTSSPFSGGEVEEGDRGGGGGGNQKYDGANQPRLLNSNMQSPSSAPAASDSVAELADILGPMLAANMHNSVQEAIRSSLSSLVLEQLLPRLRADVREAVREEINDQKISREIGLPTSEAEVTPPRPNATAERLAARGSHVCLPVQPPVAMGIESTSLNNLHFAESQTIPDSNTSRWGALHPEGQIRKSWDLVALLMFALDVFYVTFEGAFLEDSLPWQLPSIIKIFDYCTALFWVLDICLNFVTGYFDSLQCIVVTGIGESRKQYLRTWFSIDLFSTVGPLGAEVVSSVSPSVPFKFMVLIRLLKITKLARVAKVTVQRRRVAKTNGPESNMMMCCLCISSIVFVLFAASHLLACVMWMIAKRNLESDSAGKSWASDYVLLGASPLEQYAMAIHLSVSIMTGGPASYISTFANEQCFFCVCYVLALALMGVMVNEIAAIYNKMSEGNAEARATLAEASSFMSCYKVPRTLKKRIERYLQSTFNHRAHIEFRSHLGSLLHNSDGLLSELNLCIFGRCLAAHPQLVLLPRRTLEQVGDLCDLSFFPPAHVVMQPKWSPTKIMYLRSGCMEYKNHVEGPGPSVEGRKTYVTPQRTSINGGHPLTNGRLTATNTPHWLFSVHLLSPAGRPSSCYCACVSFCEALSLDIAKFNEMMKRHNGLMLQRLKIHAAVMSDREQDLASALADSGLGMGSPFFKYETILHMCARFGSSACIQQLGSGRRSFLVDIKDSKGQTPLQIAKRAGRKPAVDILVSLGANVVGKTSDPGADWVALQMSRHLSHVQSPSPEESEESLYARLVKSHIDLSTWGVGATNTVFDLFQETQDGFSCCVDGVDGRILRIVGNVRIKVHAWCDNAWKVLSETEQEAWMSLKDNVVKLPMKKMRAGDIETALAKVWFNNLGLDLEFVKTHFERGCEIIYDEEKMSGTYPGLPCMFVVHEIPYYVVDSSAKAVKWLGLPSCNRFESNPEQGHRTSGKAKKHVFVWLEEPLAPTQGVMERTLGITSPYATHLRQVIMDGRCRCMRDVSGKLSRVVHILRIRLTAAPYENTMTLMGRGTANIESQLPFQTIRNQRLEEALLNLCETMGLTKAFVEHNLERGASVTSQEEAESVSELLPCIHIFHEVAFRVRHPFDSAHTCIGLPACKAFKVKTPEAGDTVGANSFVWLNLHSQPTKKKKSDVGLGRSCQSLISVIDSGQFE